MDKNFLILIVLIIIDTPLFLLIWKFFSYEHGDFGEKFNWYSIQDIFSVLIGRHLKDKKSESEAGFFLLTCLIILAIEFSLVQEFILK